MQNNAEPEKQNFQPKRLPLKKSSARSTRRSQKHSSSPKPASSKSNSSRPKGKRATPKAIPKLKISAIFSPSKPNPSTSRTRQHSTRRHIKNASDYDNLASISSEKRLAKEVPTSQLLKSSRGATNEDLAQWDSLQLPVTPFTVLADFPKSLSKYEESEILCYSEVYCVGIQASKARNKVDTKRNFGFDDERGDYKVKISDHFAYRYEVLKLLGSGSFGQVLMVKDHKTKQSLALKVIRNKARFHQQAVVEVEVLKLMTDKDCNEQYSVVHVVDNFIFRKHMCIVFELLYMNLYELLKTNEFNGLSCNLIRRFANQITNALKLMARYKVIHCDLKPENILLKQANRSSIKVIDFGSSCFTDKRVYTYIQSRFYRAPEIILGIPYTNSIDVWSLGCILVELQTGYPLFPGESEDEQIACLMEVLGLPPKSLLKQATRAQKFFDSENCPKSFMNSRGKVRKVNGRTLESVMKGADTGLVELVKRCLDWDPVTRIGPDEILAHSWMKENRLCATKNFMRGGSSQPHQGTGLNHCHKLSFEDGPATIRNSFLAGSCRNKKAPSFVF